MNANDNNINLQEKIDSYILGKMSVEEKMNFETELANNMELKEKYELQKEISDAVQKARIKNLLVEVENEIIEEREKIINDRRNDDVGLESAIRAARASAFYHDADDKSLGNTTNKRRIWISVAASILVIFFVGFEFHKTSVYKTYGNDCYAEITAPSSRSDNRLDSLMFSIYRQIGEENYSLAETNIEEAELMITSMKETEYISDEEQKYYDDILSIKKQEIDWYDAVLKMKQGKYRKAKKELKKIANGNGIYSEKAKKILNR